MAVLLFFPAGLPPVAESKFVKQLRELKESKSLSQIPLIPSTPEEMAEMLKLCSYVRFKVPQQVRSMNGRGALNWESSVAPSPPPQGCSS